MNREQLAHVIRAAVDITGEGDWSPRGAADPAVLSPNPEFQHDETEVSGP